MSFSFNGTLHSIQDQTAREAVLIAYNGAGKTPVDVRQQARSAGLLDETDKMVEAAIVTLDYLMAHSGQNWETIDFAVTGHVNPGNKPRKDWSNDFLQVTINVREYKPEHEAIKG